MKKPDSPAQKRERLIRDLQVVAENIRNEAIRQPLLFIEASKYRVAKMRATSRAKAALKAWSGQQWLLIRRKFGEAQSRVTNDEIRSYIEKDPEYQELVARVDEAEAREEFAKLLLEAYRQREHGVRILADAEGYEASKAAAESVNREISLNARQTYSHRKV